MPVRYTRFIVCLLPTTLAAQIMVQPLPRDPQAHTTTSKQSLGSAKGATYYTENWDTGMDGWTVASGVGNLDWAWTNTGPGPTASVYPVPPLNSSTPDGWMIIDDDYLGQAGVEAESSIISPVIDLSAAPPNLKLEFDQYFQEYSDPDVETWVGVTTNGGLSWNEVLINEGVGRIDRPNPETMDLNISTWVAGDPTNVQIRFRYKATYDYGWQVDNVVIKDLPNNDMAAMNMWQTNFDFDATGLLNIEYSIYPLEQTREMTPRAALKNKGYDTQTNVVAQITVNEPGGGTPVIATAPYTAAPEQKDTLDVVSYTPGELGTFALDLDITQDQSDEVPANNHRTSSFQVDPCQWAQDDGALQERYSASTDNATEQTELGNWFDVANSGSTLYGVAVAVADSTPVGTLLYAAVYDIDLNLIGYSENDHPVQASELNSYGDSNWILLKLADPIPLDAGTAYMVVGGGYGGADQIVFGTSGGSAAQVSLIHYPNVAAPNDWFYVTSTPMVRALLGESCQGLSVNEASAISQEVKVWPDPFSTDCTIGFDMRAPGSAMIELRDVTGRVVWSEDLGMLGSGHHEHRVDGASLASGTYTWTLNCEGLLRSGVVVRQ